MFYEKNNLTKMVEGLAGAVLNLDQTVTLKKKSAHILNQITRSVTSVGANLAEALRANSYRDFMYKMHIADKEAHETAYWLRMLKSGHFIEDESYFNSLYDECLKVVLAFEEITNKDPNMHDWLTEYAG